jgi:hypothetical protein
MEALRHLVILSLLLISTPALSENALVDSLTSQLGISTQQASAGAGAMFRMAKERLTDQEFSRIAAAVPDIDKLISAVPAMGEAAGGAADVATMLGGEGALGNLVSIAGVFAELGISPEMIGSFTSIILDYLQQAGGIGTREMMQGAIQP